MPKDKKDKTDKKDQEIDFSLETYLPPAFRYLYPWDERSQKELAFILDAMPICTQTAYVLLHSVEKAEYKNLSECFNPYLQNLLINFVQSRTLQEANRNYGNLIYAMPHTEVSTINLPGHPLNNQNGLIVPDGAKKGDLLAIYTGTLSTRRFTDLDSPYLFSIETEETFDEESRFLFINGKQSEAEGGFIHAGGKIKPVLGKAHAINAWTTRGAIPDGSDLPENTVAVLGYFPGWCTPLILFYAAVDLLPGTQLFYDYGDSYRFPKATEKQLTATESIGSTAVLTTPDSTECTPEDSPSALKRRRVEAEPIKPIEPTEPIGLTALSSSSIALPPIPLSLLPPAEITTPRTQEQEDLNHNFYSVDNFDEFKQLKRNPNLSRFVSPTAAYFRTLMLDYPTQWYVESNRLLFEIPEENPYLLEDAELADIFVASFTTQPQVHRKGSVLSFGPMRLTTFDRLWANIVPFGSSLRENIRVTTIGDYLKSLFTDRPKPLPMSQKFWGLLQQIQATHAVSSRITYVRSLMLMYPRLWMLDPEDPSNLIFEMPFGSFSPDETQSPKMGVSKAVLRKALRHIIDRQKRGDENDLSILSSSQGFIFSPITPSNFNQQWEILFRNLDLTRDNVSSILPQARIKSVGKWLKKTLFSHALTPPTSTPLTSISPINSIPRSIPKADHVPIYCLMIMSSAFPELSPAVISQAEKELSLSQQKAFKALYTPIHTDLRLPYTLLKNLGFTLNDLLEILYLKNGEVRLYALIESITTGLLEIFMHKAQAHPSLLLTVAQVKEVLAEPEGVANFQLLMKAQNLLPCDADGKPLLLTIPQLLEVLDLSEGHSQLKRLIQFQTKGLLSSLLSNNSKGEPLFFTSQAILEILKSEGSLQNLEAFLNLFPFYRDFFNPLERLTCLGILMRPFSFKKIGYAYQWIKHYGPAVNIQYLFNYLAQLKDTAPAPSFLKHSQKPDKQPALIFLKPIISTTATKPPILSVQAKL